MQVRPEDSQHQSLRPPSQTSVKDGGVKAETPAWWEEYLKANQKPTLASFEIFLFGKRQPFYLASSFDCIAVRHHDSIRGTRCRLGEVTASRLLDVFYMHFHCRDRLLVSLSLFGRDDKCFAFLGRDLRLGESDSRSICRVFGGFL